MSAPRAIHHTGYTVDDLDRSLAFYRDLLGLEVVLEQEKRGGYLAAIVGHPDAHVRMAHLRMRGGAHVLELFEYLAPAGAGAAPRVPCDTGTAHLCFLVDDLRATYERLRDAGVDTFVSPPVEVDSGANRGGLALYLRDPDGMPVELFQPAARPRVALVTGAASGIGRACAERLAADGFTVVSLDRDASADPPGRAIVYDLERLDGLPALLDAIGPVDVLVNNAAFFATTPVATATLPEIERILNVNLLAGTMLAVLAGRGMRERGWGRIISITSIKDTLGERESLAYDVAKGGLAQATRTLAVELGPHGVLVNAVAPGYVSTPMSVIDGVNELDSDWFQANFIASGRLPLGRAAEPHEVASCVAWLAGDESSYVNGAVIRIDGGLSVTL